MKLALHHSKGTLNDRACPKMIGIKVPGSHTLNRLSVWSDKWEWMLEAWVPAVSKEKGSWGKVGSLPVQWAVQAGVLWCSMHRAQASHIRVQKAALMVTNCLHVNGGKQLSGQRAHFVGCRPSIETCSQSVPTYSSYHDGLSNSLTNYTPAVTQQLHTWRDSSIKHLPTLCIQPPAFTLVDMLQIHTHSMPDFSLQCETFPRSSTSQTCSDHTRLWPA